MQNSQGFFFLPPPPPLGAGVGAGAVWLGGGEAPAGAVFWRGVTGAACAGADGRLAAARR